MGQLLHGFTSTTYGLHRVPATIWGSQTWRFSRWVALLPFGHLWIADRSLCYHSVIQRSPIGSPATFWSSRRWRSFRSVALLSQWATRLVRLMSLLPCGLWRPTRVWVPAEMALLPVGMRRAARLVALLPFRVTGLLRAAGWSSRELGYNTWCRGALRLFKSFCHGG